MKFIRALLPLVLALIFAACETVSPYPLSDSFFRVRVTNPRGELISEYVAQGGVWRTKETDGYRFRAVQRLSGAPYMVESHFPNGRITQVDGPNIVVTPCGKPLWLYLHDGDDQVK